MTRRPAVQISGLVDKGGVAATDTSRKGRFHAFFSLSAWRVDHEPIVVSPLTIHSTSVTEAELERLDKAVRPDRLVRIRARIEGHGVKLPIGVLADLEVTTIREKELQGHLTAIRKPVVKRDPQFGRFTFDRRQQVFAARATWLRRAIDLTLEVENLADYEEALKVARELWAKQSAWDSRIRAFVTSNLLPLKNAG